MELVIALEQVWALAVAYEPLESNEEALHNDALVVLHPTHKDSVARIEEAAEVVMYTP